MKQAMLFFALRRQVNSMDTRFIVNQSGSQQNNPNTRGLPWESTVAIISGLAGIISFVLQYPGLGIVFLAVAFAIVWMLIFPSFARNNSRLAATFSLIVCLGTFVAGFQLGNGYIRNNFFSSIASLFLPPVACNTRSGDSRGVSLPITFINSSNRIVEVFWINEEGRSISYGDINPNDIKGIGTFLNHSWCIRDKSTGAPITAVIANDQNKLIFIR